MIEVKFIPTYEKVLRFFRREVSLKLTVEWSGGRREYDVPVWPSTYKLIRDDVCIQIKYFTQKESGIFVDTIQVATLKKRYWGNPMYYSIEVGDYTFEFVTNHFPFFPTICKELEGVAITSYRYQFGDCAERIGIDVIAILCDFIRNEMGR